MRAMEGLTRVCVFSFFAIYTLVLIMLSDPSPRAPHSSASSFSSPSALPQYELSSFTVEGKLNVHLVPHSHDDVGWLKTVDQYYIGSNNSIQVASVQYILDSVVQALWEHPHRRFIQVEQAFFLRWWREQDSVTKARVRRLITDGQLEFINGGWCMHDEAATHYIDMVDQTTLGHRFLMSEFGVVPRVQWQIDPFGHSAVQSYLLTAEAGFDAVFFARADYEDTAKRYSERATEFVWRASETLGSSAEVFGGRMYVHYMPPPTFNYDWQRTNDPPVQDDPLLFDVNVQERVDAFVDAAMDQAGKFRSNHIMWAMGDDFAYSNANAWFKNMDKLIHHVNKDGRVHVLYSTPSLYVDTKHNDSSVSWPLKRGDFFPYADCPHCYWTGYFSSRPAFKGYVRVSSALLMAARQLEVLSGPLCSLRLGDGKKLDRPKQNLGPETPSTHRPAVAMGRRGGGGADAETGAEAAGEATGMGAFLHAFSSGVNGSSGTESYHSSQGESRRRDGGGGSGVGLGGKAVCGRSGLRGGGSSRVLEEALAVAQHHDSVSGTAQQHVSNDYTLRLFKGVQEAEKVVTGAAEAAFAALQLQRQQRHEQQGSKLPHAVAMLHHPDSSDAAAVGVGHNPFVALGEGSSIGTVARVLLDGNGVEGEGTSQAEGTGNIKEARFEMCALLNISYCPPSQTALAGSNNTLVVAAYNPLGWTHEQYIRIPVSSSDVAVRDQDGATVEAQVLPASACALDAHSRSFHVRAYVSDAAADAQPFTLVFRAAVPPLSFAFFYVSRASSSGVGTAATISEELSADAIAAKVEGGREFEVAFVEKGEEEGGAAVEGSVGRTRRGVARARFDSRTGKLARLHGSGDDGVWVDVDDEGLLYYAANDGSEEREASGAYIFRPNGTEAHPLEPASDSSFHATFRVIVGPLVVELHRRVTPWASLVYRFYQGQSSMEVHYVVGPVPVDDMVGKEVVMRFSTQLSPTNATFYTDSNGRDYIARVRDKRQDWDLTVTEPVAGNYYPVNAGVYVSNGSVDWSVLVDRASGASSLKDGGVEIMLHRRLLYDDHRGVAEPLNETVCVSAASAPSTSSAHKTALHCQGLTVAGTLRVAVSQSDSAAQWRRTAAQQTLSPLQLSFSVVPSSAQDKENGGQLATEDSTITTTTATTRTAATTTTAAGTKASQGGGGSGNTSYYQLPSNVALITLQKLESYVLVRLAHLFEAKEDADLSTMAKVDLLSLLGLSQVADVVELSLTANQRKADMRPRKKWNVESDVRNDDDEHVVIRGGPLVVTPTTVEVDLGPMEIRTFAVYVNNHT